MNIPIVQLTRQARRAQLSVVIGKEASVAAKDREKVAATMSLEVSCAEAKPNVRVALETDYSRLFRETFEKLAELIEGDGAVERVEFFHAMRLMQNFGLNSADVVRVMDYGQENVCRWMNGTRCPHSEMRRHVLRKCLAILGSKLGLPAFSSKSSIGRKRQGLGI
jgi:hypothetical protein